MATQSLDNFLEYLKDKSPEVLADLVRIIDQFLEEYTQGSETAGETADVGGLIDFSTTDYTLTTSGITQEQLDEIHENVAEGMVKEKAAEWLKGVIIGFRLGS